MSTEFALPASIQVLKLYIPVLALSGFGDFEAAPAAPSSQDSWSWKLVSKSEENKEGIIPTDGRKKEKKKQQNRNFIAQ